MASIAELLAKIKNAIYGEEVRGSIHDAIEAMNEESSIAMEKAVTAQDSAVRSAATAKSSEEVSTRSRLIIEDLMGNVQNGLIPMGGATVSTLPANPVAGWMYYMLYDDVTDERFQEGAGISLLQNQRVYFSGKGKWTLMVDDGLVLRVNQILNTMMYWVDYIILASGWDRETGEYSFELDYSSSEYSIVDIIPSDAATDEQIKAFYRSKCGGFYQMNVIVAKGNIPVIDIPVKICIRKEQ